MTGWTSANSHNRIWKYQNNAHPGKTDFLHASQGSYRTPDNRISYNSSADPLKTIIKKLAQKMFFVIQCILTHIK
ncbi:MAG: hypothetical protein IJ953_07770 [Campylobacter sp.]|nr:hypothetical protein [Campylobacter sp.]